MDPREDQKRAAAQAAAELVSEGSRVGLGSGSTVAHFLAALARRKLELTCVATSPATEETARTLGLTVRPFDLLDRLDIAVDGADQVDSDLWLVKGGGGAHTREKVVAASADRFVVIVSADKMVDRIGPPVPIEVLRFGLASTLRRLAEVGDAAHHRVAEARIERVRGAVAVELRRLDAHHPRPEAPQLRLHAHHEGARDGSAVDERYEDKGEYG